MVYHVSYKKYFPKVKGWTENQILSSSGFFHKSVGSYKIKCLNNPERYLGGVFNGVLHVFCVETISDFPGPDMNF